MKCDLIYNINAQNSSATIYDNMIHHLSEMSFTHKEQAADLIKTFKLMECISNLKQFCAIGVGINDQVVDDTVAFLCVCSKLEELNLNKCNLQKESAAKIINSVKDISTLKTLDISQNTITGEAAHNVAIVISHSPNLKELYLSCISLNVPDCKKIMRALKGISTLRSFHIGKNHILMNQLYSDIASHNVMLEELDLKKL